MLRNLKVCFDYIFRSKEEPVLDAEKLVELTLDHIDSCSQESKASSWRHFGMKHGLTLDKYEVSDELVQQFNDYVSMSEVTNRPRDELAADPLAQYFRGNPGVHEITPVELFLKRTGKAFSIPPRQNSKAKQTPSNSEQSLAKDKNQNTKSVYTAQPLGAKPTGTYATPYKKMTNPKDTTMPDSRATTRSIDTYIEPKPVHYQNQNINEEKHTVMPDNEKHKDRPGNEKYRVAQENERYKVMPENVKYKVNPESANWKLQSVKTDNQYLVTTIPVTPPSHEKPSTSFQEVEKPVWTWQRSETEGEPEWKVHKKEAKDKVEGPYVYDIHLSQLNMSSDTLYESIEDMSVKYDQFPFIRHARMADLSVGGSTRGAHRKSPLPEQDTTDGGNPPLPPPNPPLKTPSPPESPPPKPPASSKA